jgi:hypothetical protein
MDTTRKYICAVILAAYKMWHYTRDRNPSKSNTIPFLLKHVSNETEQLLKARRHIYPNGTEVFIRGLLKNDILYIFISRFVIIKTLPTVFGGIIPFV